MKRTVNALLADQTPLHHVAKGSSPEELKDQDIDVTDESDAASDVTDEDHAWPDIPPELQAELDQRVETVLKSVTEQEWEDTADAVRAVVEEVISERFFPQGIENLAYDEMVISLYVHYAVTGAFLGHRLDQISKFQPMFAVGIAKLRAASQESAKAS